MDEVTATSGSSQIGGLARNEAEVRRAAGRNGDVAPAAGEVDPAAQPPPRAAAALLPQPGRVEAAADRDQPQNVQPRVLPGNTRLSISFDDSTNRFIYRGIDAETGEVVNQFPPEELVKRFAFLRELANPSVDENF